MKRRIIIVGTALVVAAGATAAFAATNYNHYTAAFKFAPTKAGSKKAPAAVSEVMTLTAAGSNGGRAAPLTDLKTTAYGLIVDQKDFPKCTDAMIVANHTKWDNACPKGSRIATGPVNALLGPANDSSNPGTPCNPFLHVYNGGGNKVVFFFTTDAVHKCGSLQTGATAPYDGTFKKQGKNLVLNVPLPPDVATKVAGTPGLYGSLIKEVLTWTKMSRKVHGKTHAFMASVACKGKKRPVTQSFTAQDYNSTASETQVIKTSAPC